MSEVPDDVWESDDWVRRTIVLPAALPALAAWPVCAVAA